MEFHDAIASLSREVSGHLVLFQGLPSLAFLGVYAGFATSTLETPALTIPLLPNL